MNSIFIGFDPREAAAFAVSRQSVERRMCYPRMPIFGLRLKDLQKRGLYRRPIEFRPSALDGWVMWDVISDAPMSTEHANARFLVPHLAGSGMALFMDGDTMARADVGLLLRQLDGSKAVYCVHHRHQPVNSGKMDGQVQTRYARKNWSSFIVFNCDHPANKALTVEMVNSLPGRDLHRLCWLDDCEIGELDPAWNFLVGHSDPAIDPKVVHFTDGTPDMKGYENCAFADEWRSERDRWAA